VVDEVDFKDAYWFLFYNDDLLVKEDSELTEVLATSDIEILNMQPADAQYIGMLHGRECYIANLYNETIPDGFLLRKVRQLYGSMEEEYFWFACRAFHILNWMKTSKYCGCCGTQMNVSQEELAMKCPSCGHTVYPRISPAIIVAVTKDDQILLARSNRFPPNRYSVIAGFVEPGESLEDCVQRELKEEVGIEVHSINYFGNQPWPFPDSLMIAFTAKCSTEEITIDNQEIVEAGWFSAHNLPDIPDKLSVARKLIDWFVEKQTVSQA
jgi:NAD+ diphosphatase